MTKTPVGSPTSAFRTPVASWILSISWTIRECDSALGLYFTTSFLRQRGVVGLNDAGQGRKTLPEMLDCFAVGVILEVTTVSPNLLLAPEMAPIPRLYY